MLARLVDLLGSLRREPRGDAHLGRTPWIRHYGPLVVLGLFVSAILLPTVGASPFSIFPASAVDPIRFEDGFFAPPHTVGSAPANGWTVDCGFLCTPAPGNDAIVRSDWGFPNAPSLRIVDVRLGGRTAATQVSTTTPTIPWSVGFVLNVTKFRAGTGLFNPAVFVTHGTGPQSGVQAGFQIEIGGSIFSFGTDGSTNQDTGFDVLLNLEYLFIFKMPGGTPTGPYSIQVNSTPVQGALEFPTMVTIANRTKAIASAVSRLQPSAGGNSALNIDWVGQGIPTWTTAPDEGNACELFEYSTEIETDSVLAEIQVSFETSPLPIWVGLSVAQGVFGFKNASATVSGGPFPQGSQTLNLTVNNAAGERSIEWTIDIINCASGFVFGYTGIEFDDPVGGTYFDPISGRVKPISAFDMVLSYDMETITPGGLMSDFSGFGNDGTIFNTSVVASEFGNARFIGPPPVPGDLTIQPNVTVAPDFTRLPTGFGNVLSVGPDFIFLEARPISVVFHFNTSVHAKNTLVWWGDQTTNRSWGVRLAEAGETIGGTLLAVPGVALFFHNETNGFACPTGDLADDENHRIIVTTDGGGPPDFTFYLDGEEICEFSGTTLIPDIGPDLFRIGPRPSANATEFTNLTIDEAHVFARELNEFEVRGFEPFPLVEPFQIPDVVPPRTQAVLAPFMPIILGIAFFAIAAVFVMWLIGNLLQTGRGD